MQVTCQQTPVRPNSNSMYGNGGVWPPQQVEPAESLCRACNISRYTFEPPSIFCTSCQQRIKRNQVRCACLELLACLWCWLLVLSCVRVTLRPPGLGQSI